LTIFSVNKSFSQNFSERPSASAPGTFGGHMATTFDIFEVTPDGYMWRCSVQGQYEKARKLQELAETSDNQFYAVDLAAGELPPVAARPRKYQYIDQPRSKRA
jgi:hypothetical protein